MSRTNGCAKNGNRKEDTRKPAAYVLSRVVTGLATVRSLAEGHMPITAISYVRREPLHYSRHCTILHAPAHLDTDEEYVAWLAGACSRQNDKPVLLPTSDADALLLAKYSGLIQPVARTWSTSHEDLAAIVNKSALYTRAAKTGIPTPPSLMEPCIEQLEQWCAEYEPPYIVKPFYSGIAPCALRQKNKRFESSADLVGYAKQHGMRACVVQPMITGGDGYIFDTYGLSDSKHRIVSYATHRRWRQFPPHMGTTSYGEIPVRENVDILFEYTQRLISQTRYHGIFGIEWLLDRKTGRWYLLDFNARPFSSIGHLTDSGLNLPLLAYYDLTEQWPDDVPQRPTLKHCYWVDLIEDFKTLFTRSDIALTQWLQSVLRCRSFAYWSLRDPGPALYRLWELLPMSARVMRRASSRQLGRLFSLLLAPFGVVTQQGPLTP